jgi:hypothetical protein
MGAPKGRGRLPGCSTPPNPAKPKLKKKTDFIDIISKFYVI